MLSFLSLGIYSFFSSLFQIFSVDFFALYKTATAAFVVCGWSYSLSHIVNKSERENQILYVNVHVSDLEKWYWWTYLWDRNRDSDIENGHVEGLGEGGRWWDELGEWRWHIYSQFSSAQFSHSTELCDRMDCSLPGLPICINSRACKTDSQWEAAE